MKLRISSLSKNEDFRSILNGKKINNKYSTIFFKKLVHLNSKKLNLSVIAKKKLGNAIIRNKIKRRIKNIMRYVAQNVKINSEYSYLIIAKKNVFNDKRVEYFPSLPITLIGLLSFKCGFLSFFNAIFILERPKEIFRLYFF